METTDFQHGALRGWTPDSSKSLYFLRKTEGFGKGKPRDVRDHLGPPLLRLEVEAAAIEKNNRTRVVLIPFGAPACSGAFGCPGGTLGGFGSGGRSH